MKKNKKRKFLFHILLVFLFLFVQSLFVLSMFGWNSPVLTDKIIKLSSFFEVFLSIASADGEKIDNKEDVVIYKNELVRIKDPLPILSKQPDYVNEVVVSNRFISSPIVVDENATLTVRAWRYSYNARGIIEVINKLDGKHTALLIVHPWGIDDGQGFSTPEPAGVAFFCAPKKNSIYNRHLQEVLSPFIDNIRLHVALVGYSLPGEEDPIRKALYRSPNNESIKRDSKAAEGRLKEVLKSFEYRGQPVIDTITLTKDREVFTYFEAFKGLDPTDKYNNSGFWKLPIPLAKSLHAPDDDIIFYDGDGAETPKKYLKNKGIKNILLCGYAIDKCVRSTSLGYESLRSSFNVFIVGDATLATFPAQKTPQMATTVALTNASLNNLITEIGWIEINKGNEK